MVCVGHGPAKATPERKPHGAIMPYGDSADKSSIPASPPQALRALGLALCKPDPGEKKPTYKGWSTRSLEPGDFKPNDLIGILGGPLSDYNLPGHALVPVDLDDAQAIEKTDDFLPATEMMEGRPGKDRDHRYFLVPLATIPEWAKSTAAQGAPAAIKAKGHPGPAKKAFIHAQTKKRILDFIGTGGQVVCPSPGGNEREWVGGTPGTPATVPFPELWEAVCKLAVACGAKDERPHNGKRNSLIGKATRTLSIADRAIAYLDKMPPAKSGEGGHNTTMEAARVVAWGFDLGREVAFQILDQHYNPRCQPPWSEKELRHKCDDADTVAFDKPRGWLLKDESHVGSDQTARNGQTSDDQTIDVATLEDLARVGAEVKWAWKGWLQKGVLNALASEAGQGKTRFCADLLRRVRHGLKWPDGQEITELGRDATALWVVADNNHDELVSLGADFDITGGVFLNASKSDPYGGVSLETVDDLLALEKRIRRVNPAFVFVDTVGNATEKDLNKQDGAKAFYQPLQILARRYGSIFLCLTHLNAGGQFLGRRVLEKVRMALRMQKPNPDDDRRSLQVHKTNSKKPPPLGVTMGDKGNEYDNNPPVAPARENSAEPGKPRAMPGVDKCCEWLKEQLSSGSQRVHKLRTAGEAKGYSAKTLYKARDVLKLQEIEDGGYQYWKLPGPSK
jgi:hypothetical protein